MDEELILFVARGIMRHLPENVDNPVVFKKDLMMKSYMFLVDNNIVLGIKHFIKGKSYNNNIIILIYIYLNN